MQRSRRRIVKALAAAPLLAACQVPGTPGTRGAPLRMTLTGQALMEHPLCGDPYSGFDDIVAEVRRGDVAFTDLEVAIRTPASGAPTRDNEFLHAAEPAVLDCLRDMGFNLLALSNNHAWDLGTEGILATRDAVIAGGFVAAGTGANLAAASAAGVWPRHGGVALVAAASGKLHDGAAATADRAGVNELRLGSDDVINADDRDRMLASIAAAALESGYVIAYLHNHQWGEDMTLTRQWVRQFARDCVAAGASVFVSHGAPLLHGIEMYKGKPLLHGLGSLVFHSRTKPGYYRAEVWQSAIVQLSFDGGDLLQLEAVPVSMNEHGDDAARPLQTRGRPRIAIGGEAHAILTRLVRLSAELGTELRIDGDRAVLG